MNVMLSLLQSPNKRQRNKCVFLPKKAIKQHFTEATGGGLISNQGFWNQVKPFLSNKGKIIIILIIIIIMIIIIIIISTVGNCQDT